MKVRKNPARNPPKIVTPRDYETIRLCALLGALEAEDASALLYTPTVLTDQKTGKVRLQTQANCQRRFLFLYNRELLDRVEQASKKSEGTKGFIYFPTNKGIRALAEYLGKEVREIPWRKINKDSSDQFWGHLMGLIKIRVAFIYSVSRFSADSSIKLWISDAELKRIHSQKEFRMSWKWPNGTEEKNTALIPDVFSHITLIIPGRGGVPGYFEEHYANIELDLGTEPGISHREERHSWERKIRMYTEFYKKGGLYQRHYQEERLGRVLTITTGEKRLANLKEITEKAGGKSRYLFTTIPQIEETMVKSLIAEAELIREQREAKSNGLPIPHRAIPTILTEPIWRKAGAEGMYTFLLD